MSLLALLPWIGLLAVPLLLRGRRRIREVAPAAAGPLVSIIVPARDEAGSIGACVATLLHSEYPRREVIVVDDRSGDGTGDIVRVMAARSEGALRAIEGEPLPAGWRGKAWACWQGYRAAEGELLLFTDADTRHEESLLGRAVAALEAGRDVLTLIPRFQASTFRAAAVLPHLWLGSMLRARLLGRERAPLAAHGQYMLVRRSTYEAVGGHEAVRRALVDDVALATRIARAGSQPLLAYAEDELEATPHDSVRGMVGEWTRRLGGERPVSGVAGRLLLLLIALGVLLLWVAPPVLLLGSLFGYAPTRLLGWASAATGLSAAFWLLVHGRLRIRLGPALIYPFGALAFAWLLGRLALRPPTVRWKGREYRAW